MWCRCEDLTGVYFLGNAPTYGSNVFGSVPNPTVYHLAGKTGWGGSFAGRPTALWTPVVPPVDPPVGPVNTLVVQVATTFQNPLWTSVVTNSVPRIAGQQFYRIEASVVEVAVDLKNPIWTPVATNSLPSGSSKFYRLVAQ